MRRVWIEINEGSAQVIIKEGHPPCGGCGLKFVHDSSIGIWIGSPSMRRVWIEILMPDPNYQLTEESPSMRRVWIEITPIITLLGIIGSPSMRRVWIEIFFVPRLTAGDRRHPPRGGCGLKL